MRRITLRLILMAGCASAIVAQEPVGDAKYSVIINSGAENFFAESEAGMLSATARISFYGTSTGQLCVVVAAKRGPGRVSKGYFSFRRSVTTDQGTRAAKLKFKFSKGNDSPSGRYSMWDLCLAGEAREVSADQDVLEVTIRRPGQEPTSFSVINPLLGYLRGTELRADAYGHMSSRNFVEKIAVD